MKNPFKKVAIWWKARTRVFHKNESQCLIMLSFFKVLVQSNYKQKRYIEKSLFRHTNDLLAQSTKLSRPRFSKSLVLVKYRVEKYRPGLKIMELFSFMTQNPVSIFQIYPKSRVLY